MSQRRVAEKRGSDNHATRDDDGDDRAEDEFVTTPQVADATEMSTRRVVKVRRPEGISTTTASTAGSGFFKDAAVSASGAAPPKPSFGFGFGASAGNGSATAAVPSTFSFGAPSATTSTTTTTPLSTSFGAAPATTTATSASDDAAKKPVAGFSFGFSSSAPTASSTGAVAGDEKKPLFGFPVASAGSGASAPASTSASNPFSFGAAPADGAKKPATSFSFGFPPTATSNTTTTTTTSEPSASESGKDTATAPDDKKPVFGAGSFNFGSAVNSFVAARSKMQEEAKDAKPTNTDEAPSTANADGDDDDDTPDPAGFGSEIVEPTARDVLANAPSKLYLFEKGEEGNAGRWVERGTGDAKLIAQPKSDNAEEHIYRLLVRGGYSLNATIKKNTFSLSKTEAKHLILLVAAIEGPQTYLLKFTGPSAEANTTKMSEALKKVIEEVSKTE